MSPSFTAIFADAAALWRAERDLWVRIAAVFFFLPVLAVGLFLPVAEPLPPDADAQQIGAFLRAISGSLALQIVAQALGNCVVLVMVFDRSRPTLGAAMMTAFVRLPAYLVVTLVTLLLVVIGSIPLIVPGLYLAGRTYLAGSTLIAEGKGPVDALVSAIRHSHGRGWMLLLVSVCVFAASAVAQGLLGGIAQALESAGVSGAAAQAPVALLVAAATAALALANVLLQAGGYRVLVSAPRQGI